MGMCGNCGFFKPLDKKLNIGECMKIKNRNLYGYDVQSKCFEEKVEYYDPWRIGG